MYLYENNMYYIFHSESLATEDLKGIRDMCFRFVASPHNC